MTEYQFPEYQVHPEWIEKSDEELIAMSRSGSAHSSEIVDFLLERHKNIVRVKTRPFFLMGADRADLIQEGMIGLYKAIMDYQPEEKASFKTFADLCVYRQVMTAVKTSMRMKNQPLNDYVSFDYPINEDGEKELTIEEMLPSQIPSPEDDYVSKESAGLLMQKINERCSQFEKSVLTMYLEGYDYHKIAHAMEKTPKAIDNALQRIKNKVHSILKQLEKEENHPVKKKG